MSIVQQPGLSADESSLAEAINAALECMELSRLYTREEIAAFLTVYKNSLLQSQKPADQSGSASYIN